MCWGELTTGDWLLFLGRGWSVLPRAKGANSGHFLCGYAPAPISNGISVVGLPLGSCKFVLRILMGVRTDERWWRPLNLGFEDQGA